jgi:putative pyruvate formate lyase activating enzyme
MMPLYIDSCHRGDLAERAREARERLSSCDLCPRECGVDRTAGKRGYCGGGAAAEVASAGPHFGEEPPLTGWGGSGTIFFAGCSLRCVFCQNADISHGRGRELSSRELAGVMVELQQRGCHNINVVTPTHVLPFILEALDEAVPLGLQVPLVWNCGGYESVESVRLLDGIVDIYMPDLKFVRPETSARLCEAPDYFDRAREALLEMHRQTGDLEVGDEGLARRGLLVRHLVLPGGLADTEKVVRFLADEVSPDTWINVMDQYRPCHEAHAHEGMGRRPSAAEYKEAVRLARAAGLHRGIL